MMHVAGQIVTAPSETWVSGECFTGSTYFTTFSENEPVEQNTPVEEVDLSAMSMGQKSEHIQRSLYKWYKEAYGGNEYGMYCREVYLDHPTLGNSAIVNDRGATYAIPYQIGGNGEVTFAEKPGWQQVMMTYVPVDQPTEPAPMAAAEAEPMAESLAESLVESFDGAILEVSEDISEAKSADDDPLKIKIKLIEPGWGNKRDNHYYSREMLEAAAPKFVGAKMYATNHRDEEKNVMTEVATILKHDGFTQSGAPVMEVGIHDPYFARTVRNRHKLGTLNQLENSILATGSVKMGEVGGRPGKIVEAINEVKSVDFVTRAGAGGHALALAESEEGAMPQENVAEVATTVAVNTNTVIAGATTVPVAIVEEVAPLLSEVEVTTLLKEDAGLPEASKERLTKGQYATKEALQEAVVTEKAYIKALTGSGRPAGLGESAAAPTHQSLPLAERRKAGDAIKYGQVGG